MKTADTLLTEKQVASLLNISIKKLQTDRRNNVGLPYKKISKSVRYSPEDVRAFLDDVTVRTRH